MNHIHRSVWSPTLGTCVATSEHVRGRTQSASSGRARGHTLIGLLRQLPLALALLWGTSAQAAPVGGDVVAGEASIGGTAQAMVIQQGTERVSINWKSFGIAAGESVQFVQPSRSSVALNRVLGSDASLIMGQLSANGQVFLINPNGVLFGKGSSVAVGGLVASTLNLSDADAQAGRYAFTDGGKGTVINQGEITATQGGYVALMAHSVSNTGTVVAPLGTVALVAGDAVTLDISGDQLINVAVARGVADAWISNGGWLQADGGLVMMSTQVAGDALSNAVNHTGVIQAQSVGEHQGQIVLLAGMGVGTLSVSGTLDVGATQGVGGSVVATGHQVSLSNATVQASGDAGGGVVLIGGGYQGQNADVPNANSLTMDANSRIQADALGQGDGGLVVLWSDGRTQAHGDISARGGASGGDGGLVETSGQRLNVSGVQVDTRAPLGQTGDWLLDPADITISSAVTSDATNNSGTYSPDSAASVANIYVGNLVTALNTSNVIITTTNTDVGGTGLGNIDVDAAITWSTTNTLTLNAVNDVNVNEAITGTGGTLRVNAGRDANVMAAISTTTGTSAFTALQDVNLDAATTVTTGDMSAVAGRNVTLTATSAVTVTNGNIVLRADNDGSGPGALEGTVTISCGIDCMTVTNGELNIRFNPVDYASTEAEILAFANTLTAGNTLNAKAWVFGQGDNKPYDGDTAATVDGLALDTAGEAADVSSTAGTDVSWTGATKADFVGVNAGIDKLIKYTSTFNNAKYALFSATNLPAGSYQTRADITPTPLTITASDVNKDFGESPDLTEFTTTPLVGSETVGSVTLLSDGQDAAASADDSPFAITASDATGGTFNASNYDITYVAGVLTIDADPVDPPIDPSTDTALDPSSAISGEQSLPVVTSPDQRPVQLIALVEAPTAQGPLSFASRALPLTTPATTLTSPIGVQPAQLQDEEPPPVLRPVPVPRKPKQDRN